MGLKETATDILNSAYAKASTEPTSSCDHKEFIDYVIPESVKLSFLYRDPRFWHKIVVDFERLGYPLLLLSVLHIQDVVRVLKKGRTNPCNGG